jgi:hypothetical protein
LDESLRYTITVNPEFETYPFGTEVNIVADADSPIYWFLGWDTTPPDARSYISYPFPETEYDATLVLVQDMELSADFNLIESLSFLTFRKTLRGTLSVEPVRAGPGPLLFRPANHVDGNSGI